MHPITYHTFGEKNLWKKFRSNMEIPMEFLHKDEFEEAFPEKNFELPIVLLNKNNRLTTIINNEELDSLQNLEDLITNLSEKIQTNLNT